MKPLRGQQSASANGIFSQARTACAFFPEHATCQNSFFAVRPSVAKWRDDLDAENLNDSWINGRQSNKDFLWWILPFLFHRCMVRIKHRKKNKKCFEKHGASGLALAWHWLSAGFVLNCWLITIENSKKKLLANAENFCPFLQVSCSNCWFYRFFLIFKKAKLVFSVRSIRASPN